MKSYFFAFVLLFVLSFGCKSETSQKKGSSLQSQLDSIELVNSQSIIESGENINKAYIDGDTNEFEFWSDMKKDHRFYGYAQPDVATKKMILFSVFTNDVDGNPFELPLGSYYDTRDLEGSSIKHTGLAGDFIETEFEDAQGEKTTVYFEKKWVILQGDGYNPEDDNEAIREYGKIEKFEDGPYPMFIVTVNFVERNMLVDFNLNIEDVNIDGEILNNLPGKYVTLYYTSDLVDDLNDLYFEGKSLSGEYAPEFNEHWDQFTGTLSGAKSLSGDLPNLISITNDLGETRSFEWYVDDVVQKAQGKKVTAYHSLQGINTITHIDPSKN